MTATATVTFRVLRFPKHRKYLPNLLNSRFVYHDTTLLRSGVEVGTHRGEFADILLKGWAPARGTLYCVDPWIPASSTFDQPDAHGDRQDDEKTCRETLAKYGSRAIILKATSAEAVREFRDGSLDWVYIDANHRRPHVDEDISLWWPKVKPGGMFAGHDLSGIWEGEVRPAVTEWAEREGIGEVGVILGDAVNRWPPWGDCATWCVFKGEPLTVEQAREIQS